jgi:hypothetical protein
VTPAEAGRGLTMRIKVIRKPTQRRIDGMRLDYFRPGLEYEFGTELGAVFLAEGWGVPAADDPLHPAAPSAPDDWTSS